MANATRLVGYVRVSTGKQDLSLEAQESRIRAMVALKEADLVDVIVDDAESGKDLNRPGAQRVLDMVRERKVDGVVIVKLDRLTRNVRDAVDLIELFRRKRVALVSVSESLDTESVMGRAMVKMMTVFAEMERETIGERTKTALQYMRQQGLPAGNTPYGFTSHGAKNLLVRNEEEQVVIARMKELRDSGLSLRDVAERLNTEGHRTRRGSEFRFQYVDNILRGAK